MKYWNTEEWIVFCAVVSMVAVVLALLIVGINGENKIAVAPCEKLGYLSAQDLPARCLNYFQTKR